MTGQGPATALHEIGDRVEFERDIRVVGGQAKPPALRVTFIVDGRPVANYYRESIEMPYIPEVVDMMAIEGLAWQVEIQFYGSAEYPDIRPCRIRYGSVKTGMKKPEIVSWEQVLLYLRGNASPLAASSA